MRFASSGVLPSKGGESVKRLTKLLKAMTELLREVSEIVKLLKAWALLRALVEILRRFE